VLSFLFLPPSLPQALARLRFDDAVNVADVEEAIRLTRMSKVPKKGGREGREGKGEGGSSFGRV